MRPSTEQWTIITKEALYQMEERTGHYLSFQHLIRVFFK